jgi:hypothetical protein
MKNSDQPIYPINEDDKVGCLGLTKREYFAIKAMQGLLAADTDFLMKMEDTVRCAVSHADALFAQLETKTETITW